MADFSNEYQSTFIFEEGINISISRLAPDGIDIREGEDGLVATVTLPMLTSAKYNDWQGNIYEKGIIIPLNARVKDMYERAQEFHKNYENIVTWVFTLAIYARAYYNAYDSANGPLLKEGHYSFDPVATILFGGVEDVTDIVGDIGSIFDMGAVPLATGVAEWWYLSEPAFLPAGFDLGREDADRVLQAFSANNNMTEKQKKICEESSDPESCELIYDREKLEETVDLLSEEKEKYRELFRDVKSWINHYDTDNYEDCGDVRNCEERYEDCMEDAEDVGDDDRRRRKEEQCYRRHGEPCEDKYEGVGDKKGKCRYDELKDLFGGMSCDEFREDARELIIAINATMSNPDSRTCQNEIDSSKSATDDLNMKKNLKKKFNKNREDFGYSEVRPNCKAPTRSLEDLLDIFTDDLVPELSDSSCDTETRGVCIDEWDCGSAGECDVECERTQCSGGMGGVFKCIGDKEVSDREYSCDEGEDRISNCDCRCVPSIKILQKMDEPLRKIRNHIKTTKLALTRAHSDLSSQLEAHEYEDKLSEIAENLEINKLGYDVFGRIDTHLVKYNKGNLMGGEKCYYDPTFEDVDKGVCGNSEESIIVYTAQIAAAALASVFSGGLTEKLLEYAIQFFPAIYDSGITYNLTETLIDDGNRIFLDNIAKEGSELYTYSPFQFEIYRDREFSIGSGTLNRVIVYIYLSSPDKLQRITDALADGSCEGGCI
jgi:hypothetical protein